MSLLGCMLGGCAASADPAPMGVVGEGRALIGPAGGLVRGAVGSVTIPPGALDRDVDIGVHAIDQVPAAPVGHVRTGAALAFTPHGTRFAKPITLHLPGAHGTSSTVMRLDDPADTTWEPAPTPRDDEFGVAIDVLGFSVYAVHDCTEFCNVGVDAGPDAAPAPDAGVDASDVDPPIDAGLEAPDAGTHDAGVTPGCGAIEPSALVVEGAGTGIVSGCPMLVCPGLDFGTEGNYEDISGWDSAPNDYVGCTRVDGDMLVRDDNVTDLNALHCLEHVAGHMVVWNSASLTSLHGLESLQQVDGELGISYFLNLHDPANALPSTEGLDALQVVGGTLRISGGEAFSSVVGMNALRVVGGDVFIAFLRHASDLAALNALEVIGGSLDLWRPEGMVQISGLRSLREIGGGFLLWGATDMAVMPGLPEVTCIGGNVDIGGSAGWEENLMLTRVEAFPKLRSIGGEVIVEDNPVLSHLGILSTVTHAGAILLNRNAQLTSSPFAPALAIDGAFEITNNPLLLECAFDTHINTWTATGWPGPTTLSNNAACL